VCRQHCARCAQEELGSPALALVRAVCEVFGLDAAASEEVALMRRNLLALVNCRPFSAAAAFKVRRDLTSRHVVFLQPSYVHCQASVLQKLQVTLQVLMIRDCCTRGTKREHACTS
jgi:hypothetical protein